MSSGLFCLILLSFPELPQQQVFQHSKTSLILLLIILIKAKTKPKHTPLMSPLAWSTALAELADVYGVRQQRIKSGGVQTLGVQAPVLLHKSIHSPHEHVNMM